MFYLLSLSPPSITEVAEPTHQDFRVVRAEHGFVLETTGTGVSVRRRLLHEVLVPRQTRFLLEDGDVIWGPRSALLLNPARSYVDLAHERQAVEHFDESGPWGVLSDAMLEHADPLGDRISSALGTRTTTPIAPHTWIGTDWRHGVLRRVVLTRPEWAAQVSWREAVLELLGCRAARFLEEVVVDLPRLEPDLGRSELAALAGELLALPWPRWLKRLHFGVLADAPATVTPQALHERLPRLERGPLFSSTEAARLVIETATESFTVEGFVNGASLPLTEGLRLRVFPKRALFESPQWPRYDSWPSWDFVLHQGRWFLCWRHGAPRSDEVKLNGMEFFNAPLLSGDRIEVMQHFAVRFELLGP
jgi:hypothetical protein